MKTFGGGAAQEASTVNSMVMGLLFARLDTQTLNGIRDAMYFDASADLKAIPDHIDDGKFPEGSNIEPKTRVAMSQVAHSLCSSRMR